MAVLGAWGLNDEMVPVEPRSLSAVLPADTSPRAGPSSCTCHGRCHLCYHIWMALERLFHHRPRVGEEGSKKELFIITRLYSSKGIANG